MLMYLDDVENANRRAVILGPTGAGTPKFDEHRVENITLKARIQILESALYAALRLRGLGEAYHDNLALKGERQKYSAKMNDIEAQIREALNMYSEDKTNGR